MNIVIKELDKRNVGDIGTCDGEFTVDSRLVLHAENNEIRYTTIRVPSFKKRYRQDEIDYAAYVDHPDKTAFLAYVNGQMAGHIILCKYWNRYAYVKDIVVDVRFRRRKIGRALIDQAKRWATERGLPGIMLETQDNNVAACRLYESCGFELRGFDTHLYKGIDRDTDEIALYWYFVFEAGSAGQADEAGPPGRPQDTTR